LSFSDLDSSREAFCGEALLPSFSWPYSCTVDFSQTVTNETEEVAKNPKKDKRQEEGGQE
jgi:hypothetical protein